MKKEVSSKVIAAKNMKYVMNETERLCKILQHVGIGIFWPEIYVGINVGIGKKKTAHFIKRD